MIHPNPGLTGVIIPITFLYAFITDLILSYILRTSNTFGAKSETGIMQCPYYTTPTSYD